MYFDWDLQVAFPGTVYRDACRTVRTTAVSPTDELSYTLMATGMSRRLARAHVCMADIANVERSERPKDGLSSDIEWARSIGRSNHLPKLHLGLTAARGAAFRFLSGQGTRQMQIVALGLSRRGERHLWINDTSSHH